MEKVLLTGSQGFIGSYITKELLDHGYHVVGVDNFSKYGHVERPHDTHRNFELIKLDLTDTYRVNRELGYLRFDYIIACAALVGGISYFHRNTYDILASNNSMLDNTINEAVKSAVRLKRFVYMSSSMVFERATQFPTREDHECLPPLSSYGFQKLAGEYMCRSMNEQHGIPYTIIRPFNAVGVGEGEAIGAEERQVGNINMLMSHVLPDFIWRAMHQGPNEEFPILGSGSQVRHFTNGRDIARGVRMAMESDAGIDNDFNISHPDPVLIYHLAEIVFRKIHGVDPKISHESPYQHDVQFRSPSVEKAKEILGFSADIELDESIDEVINWMRNSYGISYVSKNDG